MSLDMKNNASDGFLTGKAFKAILPSRGAVDDFKRRSMFVQETWVEFGVEN